MPISTVTGSGVLTTLAVSSGTNLVLPQYQTTSLFESGDITMTGSGNSVLLLGRVMSTNNAQCQVEIDVDGTPVLEDVAGSQLIARVALSVGSHIIAFNAFALANDVEAEIFGLTVIDLGL